ncbi:hypothetical protein HMPREF9336_00723 [Segniliparus rugosus ATCC BAA-974]|uniref:Lipoprotein n=1 Tax=Segniliparus rugosus (strain ATCC BAA-974 / DSM 45345 / CCUG 50838 / CIP 108380 / JCM 13579 / CDC 945) TaxID=679197 RepID=E5XMK3_SEGRC|nr:hypothetical protein HMPREF9336_00723 [Segniliparus rugosus ATCC BAA-974]
MTAALGFAAVACTEGSASPARPPQSPAPKLLPNEQRAVFPGSRLVGWCGAPGGTALGRLTGDLDPESLPASVAESARRMLDQIAPYAVPEGPQTMPTLELIATVATASPGADGMFRIRHSDSVVAAYLAAARSVRGLLLLNIQPGRSSFLDEVKAYERFLREPEVGVALDPEWAVTEGKPGDEFGSTTGGDIDAVAAYLADLVAQNDLPEKVLVYHQVAPAVVASEEDLRRHDGVAIVKSVDGIGAPADKRYTWDLLMATKPDHVLPGFKLFYDEDVQTGKTLMSPQDVLALDPVPLYVMYE